MGQRIKYIDRLKSLAMLFFVVSTYSVTVPSALFKLCFVLILITFPVVQTNIFGRFMVQKSQLLDKIVYGITVERHYVR